MLHLQPPSQKSNPNVDVFECMGFDEGRGYNFLGFHFQ